MESKFSIYLTDFWINHGIQCALVINAGGTWCTFQPQIRKTKKNYPEKISYIFLKKIFFIYFRMEFSRPNQKNFLMFFQKKFSYILGANFWLPVLKNNKKITLKKFLIFFRKKNSCIFGFWDRTFQPQAWKTKKNCHEKISYFFLKKSFFFYFAIKLSNPNPKFLSVLQFFFWCIGMELSSPKPKKQNKTHPEKVFSKKSSPHAHQKKAQIFQAKIVSYNYWKGRGAYEKTPI